VGRGGKRDVPLPRVKASREKKRKKSPHKKKTSWMAHYERDHNRATSSGSDEWHRAGKGEW